MIEHFFTFLKEVILPIGPLGVFLAAIIEEVAVPIPSAAVLFLSGFLFLSGESGIDLFVALIFKITLPAALGITIGSLAVYGAAFYFGKPFFEKWGKYVGILWADIEKTSNSLRKSSRDEFVIAGARAIPIIPSVLISAACGVIRMPLYPYLIATFLGVIPRVMILGYLGYVAGGLYATHADQISKYENGILIAVSVTVILWVLYKILHRSGK